eukprot:jgi/Hompol1/2843/HPOL_006188-RA
MPMSPRNAPLAMPDRNTWRESRQDGAVAGPRDTLPPMDMRELKAFLEEQTGVIALTIQDLLGAMKDTSATSDELQDLINEIINFVDNIVYETRGTFDVTRSLHPDIREDADNVLVIMAEVRETLLDLCDEVARDPTSKSVKQKVASTSYAIAKRAKELLTILGE